MWGFGMPETQTETLAVEFARLAGAATPGPWVAHLEDGSGDGAVVTTFVAVNEWRPVAGFEHIKVADANAAFIAFCGSHRRAILAALRDGAQREQLRLMRDDFAGLLAWQRSRPEGMTFENRLTGIPVAATAIVTVLDCLDNMLSGRDYNDEWAAEERHKNG